MTTTQTRSTCISLPSRAVAPVPGQSLGLIPFSPPLRRARCYLSGFDCPGPRAGSGKNTAVLRGSALRRAVPAFRYRRRRVLFSSPTGIPALGCSGCFGGRHQTSSVVLVAAPVLAIRRYNHWGNELQTKSTILEGRQGLHIVSALLKP